MASLILSLPLEIILKIFRCLEPRDIVLLSNTCRAMHENPAVWESLCLQLGVRDIQHVPARYRSYRSVYKRLLHAYGPLFGLWTSDYPFSGAVYEIRWNPGSENESAGVVGEKWELSRHFDDEAAEGEDDLSRMRRPEPQPPRFARVFSVTFDQDEETDEQDLGFAKAYCHRSHENTPTRCLLALTQPDLPARKLKLYLPAEAEAVTHPAYPTRECPWIDTSREMRDVYPLAGEDALREMEKITDASIDSFKGLVRQFNAFVRPFIYRERDDANDASTQAGMREGIHTRALTILCPCYQEDAARIELSVIAAPERLFPLKYEMSLVDSKENASSDWSPAFMQGLWLGGYGPHGTEVVYIHYQPATPEYIANSEAVSVEEGPHLRTWKVTGDLYVPRGVQTWACNLDSPIDGEELQGSIAEAFGIEGDDARIFSGWATISEIGFLAESSSPCFVAILSLDRIKVWWCSLDSVSTYIRYKH